MKDYSPLLGLFDAVDEGTVICQNFWKRLPIDAVQHRRRLESGLNTLTICIQIAVTILILVIAGLMSHI